MAQVGPLLIAHGFLLMFLVVFVEQIGLPIPSTLWMLAAGALWFGGKVNALALLPAAVMACLLADSIWFYLGRTRGNKVLRLMCRISLEPDSCVRRTKNAFTRFGTGGGIVVAKFVPAIGSMTPPLAGMSGVKVRRFFPLDAVAAILYCGAYFLAGYVFHDQIAALIDLLARIGGGAIRVLAVLLALYVAYKYVRRWMILRELKMARISVEELHRMMNTAEARPIVLDVRSHADLKGDSYVIAGAIHLPLSELEQRHGEFEREKEIVIYCSCPNEASAAKAALHFHRRGFKRVRPLQGGIEAWRKRDYPVEAWSAKATGASDAALEPAAT